MCKFGEKPFGCSRRCAHRVELCAAIPESGTTPSFGEIALARELLNIKLHILIRPRSGDFLYSKLEMKSMLKDIEICHKLGVDGVVFGCLNSAGNINIPQMKELMTTSIGMSVTFHRAFDMCHHPHEALEQIISLGCDRVLTSGQCTTAEKGISLLGKLNKQASDRIILLAGSGVNENNIHKIAMGKGIREFHFSTRLKESKMSYINPTVSMDGKGLINEYEQLYTSLLRVRETIKSHKFTTNEYL
jgi:copper homeostasis protein